MTKPSGSKPASPRSTYSDTDRSEVNTPAGLAPAVCASLLRGRSVCLATDCSGAAYLDRKLGPQESCLGVHPISPHVGLRERRRHERPRPQAACPHHVEFHNVQGDLGLQVKPREQSEHDAEYAVRGVGGVMDDSPADQLQYLPGDSGEDCAQPHFPASDLLRRSDAEAEPEQDDVQQERHNERGELGEQAAEVPSTASET